MKMKPGQYLTFKLDTSSYAVAIENVREINRMSEIATVPESPSFVAGVINLRGKVIPVVNLRKRFGIVEGAVTKETCIIVVEAELGHVGIIVDSVQAVIHLQDSEISASPINSDEDAFVKSIGKIDEQLIMLIDIYKCLSREDMLGTSKVA